MSGFFSPKKKGVQVGVDFMPTGVAVAVVSRSKQDAGAILHGEFLPAVGASEQTRVLQNWVDQRGMKNAECVCLIGRHDVQLFQLDKPAVEESELLAAVSWKIKDLINYDLSAAVVDTFEMPTSSKRPVQQVNAVVANENVVGGYVESIRTCGLRLTAIDVHELVVRNLVKLSVAAEQTVALLLMLSDEGLLSIFHDQDLHVTRDFKVGCAAIEAAGEEAEEVYDKVLLELQRSMDYFESSYGMGAVQQMMVFPRLSSTEKMAAYLQNYVGYDLDFIDPAPRDSAGGGFPAECFSAYCAALRGVAA
jgi:MSHA biogenesis protein MshI